MPFIQIDLDQKLYDDKRDEISAAVHRSQWEMPELGIPESDKFQAFRPHGPGELVFDPDYNGVDRQNLVVLQVLSVHRYPASLKFDFYRNLVKHLGTVGIRPEDILIAFIENGYEDWKLNDVTEAAERELGLRATA